MVLFGRKPSDPEIDQAYNQAYRQKRLELAAQRGEEDAVRKSKQKPFYQHVTGAVKTVGKAVVHEVGTGKTKGDPFTYFFGDGLGMGTQPRKRRTTHKRRRKK